MNELIGGWCDVVVLGSVQNLPLLAVAFVLDRIFARFAWTTPRRIVWVVVIAELLLPPALGSPLHVAGSAPLAVPIDGKVLVDGTVPRSLPFWLFVTWAVGAVLLTLVFAITARRLRSRLLEGAEPLSQNLQTIASAAAQRMKLRRLPQVLVSDAVAGACVLGVFRPVVLLDAATVASSNPQDVQHALLHEFGHLKRRDPLRALCMRSLLCSWWFHPSVWLAARRFAFLREVGCDRLVTKVLGSRSAYCRTLVARVVDLDAPAASPAFVRMPAEVLQRVSAMRAAGRHRGAVSLASLAAAALLLVCAVPLTAAVASKLPFGVSSLNEIPGCMAKRYYVLSQLHASQSNSSETPATEPK